MSRRRTQGAASRGATASAVVGAGLLALITARKRLLSVTVVGESMTPTYQDGQRLIVRRARRARVGQVVVLSNRGKDHQPGRAADPGPELLVKRLAALPGDLVPAQVLDSVGETAGARVPPGRIVVLGDSPSSLDSRSWGYLERDRLVGVVLRTPVANL